MTNTHTHTHGEERDESEGGRQRCFPVLFIKVKICGSCLSVWLDLRDAEDVHASQDYSHAGSNRGVCITQLPADVTPGWMFSGVVFSLR